MHETIITEVAGTTVTLFKPVVGDPARAYWRVQFRDRHGLRRIDHCITRQDAINCVEAALCPVERDLFSGERIPRKP